MLLKLLPVFLAIVLPILAQNSHMFVEENLRRTKKEAALPDLSPTKANNHEPFVEENYRLPTSLSPTSYFIRLLPFVNGDQSVRGYVEIDFVVSEVTSNITLHMAGLTFYEDTISLFTADPDVLPIEFSNHVYDADLNFYIGNLVEPLEQGRVYKLSMSYDTSLSVFGLLGFYKSTYVNAEGQTISLATTQMQPNFARSAFPCFDEPSFKASFQLEIGREDSMNTLNNMPVNSTRPIEGMVGWTWDLFDVSVTMSSYLNAFVVSDFVSSCTTSDTGVPFCVWTYEEQINQVEYSLDAGHRMQTYFELTFDIPYPLPKQDMIAIPDYYFGAMENWGLVTYVESRLLVDPVLTTISRKRSVAQIIGHEIIHMWFGNLVTCAWWSDAWLNEGFAAYYQYYGNDVVEPDWDIMYHYVRQEMHYIFGPDSLESSLEIRRDVPGPSQILDLFGGITYSKGSTLVRMMEYFLTIESYSQGIVNYLNDNAYSNTYQEDLFKSLNDQAQLDGTLDPSMNVQEIMESWTLQPGYPLLTVQIIGDGTAQLTQQRYLQTPNEDAIEYTYWIPITYTSGDSPNFDATYPAEWMTPSDSQLTISGLSPGASWHIFNVQQSSYYRVNYDNVTWSGIAAQLIADFSIIDIRNRAQLIDDSFHLAQSGRILFDVPFNIASYLNNEDHYVPWEAALDNMAYIERMFSRSDGYAELSAFLSSKVNPLYDTVGSEDGIDDTGRTMFLRREIVPWSCDLLYQPCLDSATEQYAEWMLLPNDLSIISPDMKSSVYCTAVSQGSDAEWEFALGMYQSTVTNLNSAEASEEVSYLLFAMACSKDEATLIQYLDMAFNGEGNIVKDDAYTAFANVASTDIGRDVAWDYLNANYIALAAFYESFDTVQRMAAEVADEFNTEEDLLKMESFKTLLSEVNFGSTAIIDAAIQTVEANILWMDTNYDNIVRWLTDNGFGTM